MAEKAIQPTPTISMEVVKLEDGTYGVSALLTGLEYEEQAKAALSHMQKMFCGQEIKEN